MYRWMICIFAWGIGCWFAGAPAVGDEVTNWRAAAARVVITPDEPMFLAGFGDRVAPAQGTAQDLFAKALAIEDATGKRLVIVTLDLVDVPKALRASVAAEAAKRHGLPPEGLLLNCSHTHCGPELRFSADELAEVTPERADRCRRYTQKLHEKVVGLVTEAIQKLAPAKLSYSHARCGFAMNRRLKSDLPDGDPYLNRPNPDGVVDHDVPVLKVERLDGTLAAVAFGYACHNTSLKLMQYHGDYAGHAQAITEAAHPGATALFLMGCGGDQNAYPRFRDEYAEQHGRALATAVEAALGAAQKPLTGPLRAAYGEATLDYASLPTAERLKARMETGAEYPAKYHDVQLAWDRRRLRELERGTLAKHYPCPVQVVRFGDDLTLVAIGGETVVDYSLRLKRELGGAAKVWVAGYSNDVFAYLPSRRVLLEGGYEAERAISNSSYPVHPSPFSHRVEEQVFGRIESLLKTTEPRLLRTDLPPVVAGKWDVLEADKEMPSRATLRPLLSEVHGKLAQRANAMKSAATKEQVEGRQTRFREFLQRRLGDVHPTSPLNARVVGRIAGHGYNIEKVIFESRPKFYVTGLLYLPSAGRGPYPGVLVPCGHTAEGKAFPMEQHMCRLLARKGLAAFCFDPIGQGERCFMVGSPAGARRYRSTYEHTLSGLGAWLVGGQPATDHIIDAVRALDYLASRPEVDPKRLGCTGNSGGGNLTSYLMVLDDRIAAAAPCCWLTRYGSLLSERGPQDAEQLITGHLAAEFDVTDYVIARLPKPVLIEAGRLDTTFRIDAVRELADEARRTAKILQAPHIVDLAEADEPHGFTEPLREASVAWLKRWLDKEQVTIDEKPDTELHTVDELRCTPTGSVLDLDGARNLYELHSVESDRLRADREAFWRDTPRPQALAKVRELVGAKLASLRDKPTFQLVRPSEDRKGVLIAGIRIEAALGLTLPGLLFLPQSGDRKTAVLYLHEDGKQAAAAPDGECERLARSGKIVLAVDVRGLGELESHGTSLVRPHDWSRNFLGPNLGEFLLAMLLDRSLVGLQVDDIATCRDVLDVFSKNSPLERVELVAEGRIGVAALHAAALGADRFQHVTLRRTLATWTDIVRSRRAHDQGANTVFAALTTYDLPDLVRSLPAETVTIEEPLHLGDVPPTPTYANHLTYEQALDGWLAIFDGQSTFGWRNAKLGQSPNHASLLEGTTTTEFGDYELRVHATRPGELLLGGESVTVRAGWNVVESRGRRGAITLKPDVVVEAMFLKPVDLRPLLNGRSMAGWDKREVALLPPERRARWTFENGVVRAVGGPGALEYAPASAPNTFGDFVAQLVVKTRRNDTNGGFFFRNEPGKTMMGYEAQLHHKWYDVGQGEHGCTTGGIDDRQQARAAVALDHVPVRMTVIAHGPHLATWVNGYQTADWTDPRDPHPNPRQGRRVEPGTIQLQAHDPDTDLEFHQVWLRELPPPTDSPETPDSTLLQK